MNSWDKGNVMGDLTRGEGGICYRVAGAMKLKLLTMELDVN